MASLRDAAASLFEIFDRLGISYAVGGSVASSLHGVARATQDVDIVVDLPATKVNALCAAVQLDYYADSEMMLDTIGRGASFNLIHMASGHKFDLFIAARHPLGAHQLAHRLVVEAAGFGGEPVTMNVISPEDTILAKLHWYRAGGEVSERQWNDLVSLAAVQTGRLDLHYLRVEAKRLGVENLLLRLMD